MPMMRFVSNLGYVGVVITGGYLAVRGRIALGDIQAFTQYIRGFTEPITQLANISNVLQQTVAAAERVFEFLEAEEETPDPEQPVRLETGGRPGGVPGCALPLRARCAGHPGLLRPKSSLARRSPSWDRRARARRRWSNS
jgi:ABC-type multidrug transport system fused ATPase/permease subunit